MIKYLRLLHAAVATFLLLVALPACGGKGAGQSAPKQILIGASIPETGSLAAFGTYEKWGYTAAIADVNKSGGIYLSQYKVKVPVLLKLYDDESRPELATSNTQRLILNDKVNALLGSATPPQVIPGAIVAERNHVPVVTGVAPIRAFLAAQPKWSYVWDIFFDELDMTQQQFLTMNTVQSNKQIALFTDNEQDGVTMGKLWEQTAPKFGYHIAYHAQLEMDAIASAGSLDANAINTAIGKTDKTYVVGPINFAKGPGGHTSALPTFMLQWQNGQTQIVYPDKLNTAKLIY